MPEDAIPLDDGREVTLPIVDVLTGRGFITGESGWGKSTTASVVAEELLDRGFPLMIIDVEGQYWGLKEQYEVPHVGADEECDLRVGPEHGEKLAHLAQEQGVTIILDVSGNLDAGEGEILGRETARRLFDREKKLNRPLLLVIGVIHEYIPEGAWVDEAGGAKRGRRRGLGVARPGR